MSRIPASGFVAVLQSPESRLRKVLAVCGIVVLLVWKRLGIKLTQKLHKSFINGYTSRADRQNGFG
jgi:hypothetical protein